MRCVESLLERSTEEGESPVHRRHIHAYDPLSTSRVVWDCSSKWVVNSI